MGIREKLKNFIARVRTRENLRLEEKNEKIQIEEEQTKESFSDKLKREYPILEEYSKIESPEGMFIEKLHSHSVILIGPSGAGKSTVANELAQMTGMPIVRLDSLSNRNRKKGYINNYKDIESYNIDMLKVVMEQIKESREPGIIDFGAGHSIYEDKKKFEQLKLLLEDFENIVLLLPSKDDEKALKIMKHRSKGDTKDNKRFIESPCNRKIATMIIYGEGKRPEEIASEILVTIAHRRAENKDSEIGEEK